MTSHVIHFTEQIQHWNQNKTKHEKRNYGSVTFIDEDIYSLNKTLANKIQRLQIKY